MPLVQSLAARAWGLMVAACAVVAGLGVVLSGTAHDHEGRTSWATVATVLAVALAAVGLAAWLAVRSVARRLGDLTAALEVVAAGDLHATVPVGRPDEIGAIAIAAGRSADRLRHTLTTVARSTAALDAGWRSVLETSNQMSDTAEGAAAMATAAAVSATLVSNNVQCVAAATEQLAGTTREVALHAAEASAVARSATDQAGHATSTVAALGESSQRVEHIVDIIRTVAAQTHLLALNATIEAARAGDAGLGFTVVAGEVKSLAAETSRATGQVSQSVTEIQAGSGEAGTAIAEISQIIERVSDNQTAIAAAVEEQTAATHEIGRGAAEAAVGSAAVAAHIARLVSDAKASAYAGAQCRTSASEIAEATLELEALIAGLDLPGPLDVAVGQDRVVARAHVLDGVTVVEDTVHGSGVHEFEYVGTWSHSLTNANAAADNDGSNSYSSMAGDVARLRFVGRQIRFLGVTDANHGVGAVAVDGGPETLVDQYSAVRGVAVDLWTSPLLPYGEHVFTLRVTGTMNADSRYVWTAVDRVEIV